jgi:hypothetical protein
MGERNLTQVSFVLLHALIARPWSLYGEDVAGSLTLCRLFYHIFVTDVHSLLC